jgi:phosphatidylserine decarboxylase
MIKTREGWIITRNVKQNRMLKKLYGSLSGRLLLKILTAPAISKNVGKFMDSQLSVPLIKKFLRSHRIDMSLYRTENIHTYNEFFTRQLKNSMSYIDTVPEHLISPCDAKLSAYRISEKSIFLIKDSPYRIDDLLRSHRLAKKYCGGICLIFRLEVDDYHRYCYIDSGKKTGNTYIQGELHTVNPIALEHYNIYKRNCREYTILRTDNFGDVVQIEVGAMLVGKIANHHGEHTFRRGEEKGMFRFGGSTIVLLMEKDTAVIDSDILQNTADGYETIVGYGEKIGVRKTEKK